MIMADFALSIKGGSAKAFGAIGVVRFLQENNLVPKIVAGSSGGAIVASMYAIGYDWEKMLELVTKTRISRLFSLRSLITRQALISEKSFANLLLSIADDSKIEDLPTKLVVFASRMDRPERVLITEGSLLKALQSSCAFPYILPAGRGKRKSLIDGDLTPGFSAAKLRELGVKKVIGVARSSGNEKFNFGAGLDKVIDMFHYLSEQIDEQISYDDPVDLEINYKSDDIKYFGVKGIEKTVEKVYRQCVKLKPEILKVTRP
jgi:NTE family protein